MTQRNPDYSIRDHLIVAAQEKASELANSARAKRISDWLHNDLRVPEVVAITGGSAVELGARAISLVSEGASMVHYGIVVGIEDVSDAYDDVRSMPVHPIRSMKRFFKNAKTAHAHTEPVNTVTETAVQRVVNVPGLVGPANLDLTTVPENPWAGMTPEIYDNVRGAK